MIKEAAGTQFKKKIQKLAFIQTCANPLSKLPYDTKQLQKIRDFLKLKAKRWRCFMKQATITYETFLRESNKFNSNPQANKPQSSLRIKKIHVLIRELCESGDQHLIAHCGLVCATSGYQTQSTLLGKSAVSISSLMYKLPLDNILYTKVFCIQLQCTNDVENSHYF